MSDLDLPLDLLRSVALRELSAAEGRPLFVTISGAHLYGFASPDSDFDLRAAHVLPLPRLLSLHGPRETIEFSRTESGRDIDLVSHEAGKFFRLMLKKNGYVMEQIFSPLVVVGGEELEELRRIARGCFTRHLHHHYHGFAENQRKQLEREPEKKVKTLLYLYRVLLTGIHVLRAGEIEADLRRLLDLYPQGDGVRELIAAKVREAATLTDEETRPHLAVADRLSAELDRQFAATTLPEEPRSAAELDAFLIAVRMKVEPSP